MFLLSLATFATCVLAGTPMLSQREPAPRSEPVTYSAPSGEPASQDYEVKVNGKPVFCYTSFRFDLESKKTIAGRPVSPLSFCSFDHDGEVEIEIRLLDGLRPGQTHLNAQ